MGLGVREGRIIGACFPTGATLLWWPVACCRVRLPLTGVFCDYVIVSTHFWPSLECICNCVAQHSRKQYSFILWFLMMTNFVLRSHFPLKSDIPSLLLSHYCHIFCVFFAVLLLLILVEQLQETLKPLDTKKKPVYWILIPFLSKSWIYMELFGNFLCCYRAATKWNWPAAVTLFFATVPMLRTCSLLSCKLGQGQKQVSHPMADCTNCVPSLALAAEVHRGRRAGTPHSCNI